MAGSHRERRRAVVRPGAGRPPRHRVDERHQGVREPGPRQPTGRTRPGCAGQPGRSAPGTARRPRQRSRRRRHAAAATTTPTRRSAGRRGPGRPPGTTRSRLEPRPATPRCWPPAGDEIRTRCVDGTTQATGVPARAAAACGTVPAAVATVSSSRRTTSKPVRRAGSPRPVNLPRCTCRVWAGGPSTTTIRPRPWCVDSSIGEARARASGSARMGCRRAGGGAGLLHQLGRRAAAGRPGADHRRGRPRDTRRHQGLLVPGRPGQRVPHRRASTGADRPGSRAGPHDPQHRDAWCRRWRRSVLSTGGDGRRRCPPGRRRPGRPAAVPRGWSAPGPGLPSSRRTQARPGWCRGPASSARPGPGRSATSPPAASPAAG